MCVCVCIYICIYIIGEMMELWLSDSWMMGIIIIIIVFGTSFNSI